MRRKEQLILIRISLRSLIHSLSLEKEVLQSCISSSMRRMMDLRKVTFLSRDFNVRLYGFNDIKS
jgi:hypothetical protein